MFIDNNVQVESMKNCTFKPETGRTQTERLLSDILDYSLETDTYQSDGEDVYFSGEL